MKILIGDDHLLFREGLRRLLETLGPDITFREAGTFGEMQEEARSGTHFDLALMDLQMPGWPGFQGVAEIKKSLGKAPLIVVSASETREHIRLALEAGASGYIPKSSSVKVMLGAVNLVFSGGVYVPSVALQDQEGGGQGMLSAGPAAAESDGMELLTPRQRDVLRCLKEGKSNKQIAYELNLSEGTVKIHATAIFRTLGVRNRTQAVIAASEMGRRETGSL
ncbi:MAG: response regulator transcription factor [Pseudomonadota bacterium]|nr:response regulator transcription factor [Pseudomonadota bacterium]